jgi:hypothetical protein
MRRAALALAKHNLVHAYAAFGITEYFADSVALFGHTFPALFPPHAADHIATIRERTSGDHPPPTLDALRKLDALLDLDTELYAFARQVLAQRQRQCTVGG